MSDGVEHLQRAAHELISAARSFLDAAEEIVDDRDLMADAGGALRSLARDVAGPRGAGRWAGSSHPFDEHLADDDDGDDGDPGTAADHSAADHSAADARADEAGANGARRVRRIHVE